MKFTKKCDSTQHKISISNRRRSSAGMFYTSSAGAVTSLILMLVLGITGATNLLGLGGSASAADNISLTVDTNNLTVNMAPMSSSGNFAKSGNMNIGVSTTSTSGYTLSIASSTGSTDLINQSDNTKKINSLSSAISESDFSSSTNTQYNNKWGYKPSQYVTMNGDDPVIHPNTDYRPLPGTSGEIIAKTSVANPTADNYTLSIGARATNTTTKGDYTSDTFVITAVTNFTGLTITYDGNGLYFNNDPTQTTNSVLYDATMTSVLHTEKYSHTPNVDDAGVQSGTYPEGGIGSYNQNDVVTIPGASSIHISFKYSSELNYDFTTIWQGSHPDYTAESNYSSGIQSCGTATSNSGRFWSDKIVGPVECDISGDTVTFGFFSDWNTVGTDGFGYYAVITGLDSSGNPVPYYVDTYSKSTVSGAYATPGMNTGATEFMGWSENASATTPAYTDEADISANLHAVNGDPDVTLYAIYDHADTAMQDMNFSQCTTTGLKVYDNRDNSIYLVKKLAGGKCWMLDNLRLDLTNSTILNGLTTSNTHVDADSLTSLRSGNRSKNAKYASSGFVAWARGDTNNVYNQAKANADHKDTVASITYGEGSGKIGVYYNYCAASAGSYCYDEDKGTGNASYDLCPAGWRMPTGGGSSDEYRALYTAYSSDQATFKNALSTPLSGFFYNGSADRQGALGYFWSSTYYNANSMYYLYVSSSSVSPFGGNSRISGNSVRCVKAPTMQSVTNSELASMLPNTGDTVSLKDERDGKDYNISKLADGKYWMVQNLNLAGGTTLSSNDTDMDASWTLPTANGFQSGNRLPASSTSGFSNSAMAYVYNSAKEGTDCSSPGCYGYYSWTAATLGSGLSITADNTDAPYSICPKGWHLPNTRTGTDSSSDFRALMIALGGKSSVEAYTASTSPTGATMYGKLTASPYNFLLAGNYNNSDAFVSGGSNGSYWSATSADSTNAHRFDISSSSVNSDSRNRRIGRSVRCVFGS